MTRSSFASKCSRKTEGDMALQLVEIDFGESEYGGEVR